MIVNEPFKTAAEAHAFALAGKATLTLVSRVTEARFTYQVRASADGQVYFVNLLNGPDNENHYSYFGYIRRGIFFHGGAKAKIGYDAPSVKAFDWTWKALSRDLLPATLEVWHEGRCGRCNRKLTVPSSVASGLGPECAGKFAAAWSE
jgi:hypothetical protein